MPPVLIRTTESNAPNEPKKYKKLPKYKPEEINFEILANQAREKLHKEPFQWQLEAARAVLCGEDVVVDVGTGSGKTLVFSLPLLKDDDSIMVTVSPLTALMIDQANSAEIPTVAVCAESISKVGPEQLYEDIASGKYRQVLVSPEIALSDSLRKSVISKQSFHSKVRAVCVDEAHCMSLWGGSFRPDYAGLGKLRGVFPKNIPFIVASATLPMHVLDDIKRQIRLDTGVKMISVSNARPNVALSVRQMQFSEDSKADLRFLIPEGASKPEDIPITLVYGNSRTEVEDIADHLRDWMQDCGIDKEYVAFYHARVGDKRKRELEERLRSGQVRILACTEAVGMGCDMRNIVRVILWGLPPSFCALVQRAGRAGRDFLTLGEAILIVSKSVIDKGTTEFEVEVSLNSVVTNNHSEAENRSAETEEVLRDAGIDPIVDDGSMPVVSEEGTRVEQDSEPDDDTAQQAQKKKRFSKDANILEVKYLNMFVGTTTCLRKVWDQFFGNEKKLPLQYPSNTLYQPLHGERCCYRCTPRLFPVETISVTKSLGLKRGRKKNISASEVNIIRNGLIDWRDSELVTEFYGDLQSLSGATILGDDIIEKIANCGQQIHTYDELRRHCHWRIGHDDATNGPNQWATELLEQLHKLYLAIDVEEQAQKAAATQTWTVVTPESFYANTRKSKSGSSSPSPQPGMSMDTSTTTKRKNKGNASGTRRKIARSPVEQEVQDSQVSSSRGRGSGRGRRRGRGRGRGRGGGPA